MKMPAQWVITAQAISLRGEFSGGLLDQCCSEFAFSRSSLSAGYDCLACPKSLARARKRHLYEAFVVEAVDDAGRASSVSAQNGNAEVVDSIFFRQQCAGSVDYLEERFALTQTGFRMCDLAFFNHRRRYATFGRPPDFFQSTFHADPFCKSGRLNPPIGRSAKNPRVSRTAPSISLEDVTNDLGGKRCYDIRLETTVVEIIKTLAYPGVGCPKLEKDIKAVF